VAPPAVTEEDFPAQLRRFLLDKPAYLARQERVFTDVAEAVAIRTRRGLSATAAGLLVRRGLRKVDGGLAWTADPRLQSASAVKLTGRQIQAVLEALAMPTLLLLAEDTPDVHAEWMEEQARSFIGNLAVGRFPGGHHFHMEEDVQAVAETILKFFAGGAPG
jgi:pimeloyl-ACP methyl ester carboxylesterase